MGKEIERKFLVNGDGWKSAGGILLRQGYLSTEKKRTVRVRIEGDQAFLTIKGETEGVTRREYEYAIPLKEAEELLDHLCEKPLIEKRRYTLEHEGYTWVIDEFFGQNEGLVVAEIELPEEHTAFSDPVWLGREVSHDPRYYNANLVQVPYSDWEKI